MEQFLLNYVGWNIDLVSVSEIIYCVAYQLEIPDEDWEKIHEYVEDFINYVMSESEIYTSFDQFTIALSVIKLVFERNGWDFSLKKLADLVHDINYDFEMIKNCQILIKCLFDTEAITDDVDDKPLSTNISVDDVYLTGL